MYRALLLSAVLAACERPPANQEPLVDLTASIEPVKREFNARFGQPRFLALLSPT